MEYVDGKLYIAALRLRGILRVDAKTWQPEFFISYNFPRAHGMAYGKRDNSIWLVTGLADGLAGLIQYDAAMGRTLSTVQFETACPIRTVSRGTTAPCPAATPASILAGPTTSHRRTDIFPGSTSCSRPRESLDEDAEPPQFIKTTAVTAAALASGPLIRSRPRKPSPHRRPIRSCSSWPTRRSTRAQRGASYADVRVGRYRRQTFRPRERQVSGVADEESYGLGIRTLVNGCWGFAATSAMTRAGVQAAAREAITLSRAAHTVQRRPVELAPATPVTGTWMTPVQRDPIDVPLEEKIALLLARTRPRSK